MKKYTLNFKQIDADPCLVIRIRGNPLAFQALYFDENSKEKFIVSLNKLVCLANRVFRAKS